MCGMRLKQFISCNHANSEARQDEGLKSHHDYISYYSSPVRRMYFQDKAQSKPNIVNATAF